MKLVLFILIFLFFLSCTKDRIIDPIEENKEISNIDIYLVKPTDEERQVTKSEAILWAEDIDTLFFHLDINSDTIKGKLSAIPPGRSRRIEMFCYDENNYLLYRGFNYIDVSAETDTSLEIKPIYIPLPPELRYDDYFPLKVGNVWLFEYTSSQYSGDGMDYTFYKGGGTIRWEIVSYNNSIYKVREEKIDTVNNKKDSSTFEITKLDEKNIKFMSNGYAYYFLQRFYEKNPSQDVIEYKTGDVNETKLRLGKNIGILYRYSSYSGITFGSSNRLELKKFNDIVIE